MADSKKCCIIANIGAHYRQPIFKFIAQELNCDFYFGDHVNSPIKQFKYEELPGYKGTLKNKYLGKFYWQRHSTSLIYKDYDIYFIDGEPYCLSSWMILLLAKIRKKKVIAWTHGWYGRESNCKKIIKRIFYSLHHKLMVYNEYAINLMAHNGINSKKMLCIANSLDSDYEKNLRKNLSSTTIYSAHFGNEHPVIIYCGRIQKSKRLDLVLNSIANLKREGIYANAIIVGKDVENTRLDLLAENLGISNQIWLYGPCFEDKILAELFFNANVCVSPGNVGLTAIHSLTFGCPVITHNNFAYQGPEFEAIIPNATGDFFIQDDLNDLTDKILKWINLDNIKRHQVRETAYAEIDRKWNIYYQMNIIKRAINE